MAFAKPSGEPLPVLADINISLPESEILGLLGRSGSGKSTLLRIAGGLIKPTSGDVLYRGRPLFGPAEGIAVVFQTFALYPWLTVLENVELGLDALHLSLDEATRRAMSAIDLIGLDGFQSAYPRELSGGMRQRVGFARAIVSDPVLLLMDEPFSALDVLTAETLRTDFLDLWLEHQLPTKSVLMVTHNIEEAVLMCDRVLVLSSNPGRISLELPVTLPQPRNRLDSSFRDVVDEIYSILTARAVESLRAHKDVHRGVAQPLPAATVQQIRGLLEAVAVTTCDGHAALGTLAKTLGMSVTNLLPVAEALDILEFGEIKDDAVSLTAAGRVFVQSPGDLRRPLFAEHLLRFVPLAAHVQRVLNERPEHRAPKDRFIEELEDHLDPRDAESTLHTLIGWGTYAQMLTYDHRSQTISEYRRRESSSR